MSVGGGVALAYAVVVVFSDLCGVECECPGYGVHDVFYGGYALGGSEAAEGAVGGGVGAAGVDVYFCGGDVVGVFCVEEGSFADGLGEVGGVSCVEEEACFVG